MTVCDGGRGGGGCESEAAGRTHRQRELHIRHTHMAKKHRCTAGLIPHVTCVECSSLLQSGGLPVIWGHTRVFVSMYSLITPGLSSLSREKDGRAKPPTPTCYVDQRAVHLSDLSSTYSLLTAMFPKAMRAASASLSGRTRFLPLRVQKLSSGGASCRSRITRHIPTLRALATSPLSRATKVCHQSRTPRCTGEITVSSSPQSLKRSIGAAAALASTASALKRPSTRRDHIGLPSAFHWSRKGLPLSNE
mmetsp:Transcript_15529/g.49988  ORF Transcript_15529/g.49988 Transcript_15529/m.49988 type:complete len:249 (+) Transcript_15529:1396-2142(+)